MAGVGRLMDDIKDAMKSKDSERLLALRTLHSDMKNVALAAGRREPDEADLDAAVAKAIKQRRDAAEQFRKGGREELALVEEAQIELYKAYQPEQLSAQEIEALVAEAIAAVGAASKKEFGKVMGAIMPKVKGKADMGQVQTLIKDRLPD